MAAPAQRAACGLLLMRVGVPPQEITEIRAYHEKRSLVSETPQWTRELTITRIYLLGQGIGIL